MKHLFVVPIPNMVISSMIAFSIVIPTAPYETLCKTLQSDKQQTYLLKLSLSRNLVFNLYPVMSYCNQVVFCFNGVGWG